VALDVRSNVEFGAGHVPGSLNVGLGGQFASWAGTLLDPARPVLIVAADDTRIGEAAMRLARVGLENVAGSLAGGVEAWRASGRPVATIPQITVAELRSLLGRDGLQVVDVRRPAEYAGGHVPGAVPAPLDRIASEGGDRLDPSRPTAVVCAGGYRSSAAASLLAARGFTDLRNVIGGTGAWVEAGYEVERPT